MSRRGILFVCGGTLLLLLSLAAAAATYVGYLAVALEPARAIPSADPGDVVVVSRSSFWPSVTVTDGVTTETVSAGWWLMSPLLVIGLGVVLLTRSRRTSPSAVDADLDDTRPVPVAPRA